MDITLERILSLLPKKPDGSLAHGARTAFAKSIGAPSNIFAEWIAGRNGSYKNYLYQIADKYNVSVEWLKGESDQKEKSPTPNGVELSVAKKSLIEKIYLMDEDMIAALNSIADQVLLLREK